jgi:RNA polymerase sigma-70 factor (ECF subfamily)
MNDNDKEKGLEPAREQRDEAAQEEARLIRQAQDGDQRAFEALVKLHERRRQDVEDLAQEVFLKAYLAIGRFRPGAPFAPWLHRIAVNTCYDHLRGIRRRPEIGLADLAESEADFLDRYVEKGYLSGGGEVDDRLAARDLAERILATLPPKDRLAITLREVNGFEIAEVARALGCSRAAAKVRLFRARRAMQAALRRLIRQDEQEKGMGDRAARGGQQDDLS